MSSYFRKQVDSRKTRNLVNTIYSLKHIVVPTESDALILENTLIKEHQPKYGQALPPNGLYDGALREVERPLIELTLEATRGNQVRAAELLGINRNTLRKKIRELGIDVSRAPLR